MSLCLQFRGCGARLSASRHFLILPPGGTPPLLTRRVGGGCLRWALQFLGRARYSPICCVLDLVMQQTPWPRLRLREDAATISMSTLMTIPTMLRTAGLLWPPGGALRPHVGRLHGTLPAGPDGSETISTAPDVVFVLFRPIRAGGGPRLRMRPSL